MSTGISNNFVSLKGLSSCSVNTGNTLLSRIEPDNWFSSITRKISSLSSSMREVVSGVDRRTGLIAALRRCFIRHENVNGNACEREPVTGEVDLKDERSVLSNIKNINDLYRKVLLLEQGLKDSWSSEHDLKMQHDDDPSTVKLFLEDQRARRDDVSSIRASLKRFLDRPYESRYPIIKSSAWERSYPIISRYKKDEIDQIIDRVDFLKEVKKMESRINEYRKIFVDQDGKNELDTDEIYSQLAEQELEKEKSAILLKFQGHIT